MARMTAISTTYPLQYRIQDARRDDDHDLLGERILVPYVDSSSPETDLNYREGTITEIHVYPELDPGLLTVEIDEDEHVYIDSIRYEQK